jgi:acid phosphatase family membrane protein YuiD
MTFFTGIVNNKAFLAAFSAWFLAQLLKVIFTLIKDKRLNVYRMIGSGGMPSSHSSFVMALSTFIGLESGFDSTIYAIALVYGLIVMYDASGVRRAVGKQAILLNTLIEDLYAHKKIQHGRLKELVGHTPYEVFAGGILGIIIANLVYIK